MEPRCSSNYAASTSCNCSCPGVPRLADIRRRRSAPAWVGAPAAGSRHRWAAAVCSSGGKPSAASSTVVPAAELGEARNGSTAADPPLVTVEEVQQIALSRGLHMAVRALGPAFRIVCRDGGEGGPILAVTTGFVVPPLGIMHCDTLQVFTAGQRGEEGARTRGSMLGLGLLVGAATFAHGISCGCRRAEILAINDDDAWHVRLVAYYSRFGFVPVRRVEGGTLADLPHMLVWGGVGTRMDADIPAMLQRWTPAIRSRRTARAPE